MTMDINRLTKQEFLQKYSEIINEEQLNQLKFDWFNQTYPIKQRLPKDDLSYLFLKINLSVEEIADCFGCIPSRVRSATRFYGLTKTKEQRKIVTTRTYLKIYGVEHPYKLARIREKMYKTNIEKYGTYCSAKAECVKQKVKNNNQQKYGVDSPLQLPQIQEKSKQTLIKKYGVDNASKCKEIQDKIRNKFPQTLLKMQKTCMERYGAKSFWTSQYMDWQVAEENAKNTIKQKYGVDNIRKLPQFIEKAKQTCMEKYGVDSYPKTTYFLEKMKQTNIKKYGVPFATQNEEIKQYIKNTMIEKYGVESVMKLDYFKQKVIETGKRNNSYGNKSKPENEIFECLKLKFNNVERQYKSIEYPYCCDFYIPDLNLYIEYQGYQGHGKEPYDPDNQQHQDILNLWIQKDEEFKQKGKIHNQYHGYIKSWTISDPLKRKTAKDNNLNWIEFFNLNQFYEWYGNK